MAMPLPPPLRSSTHPLARQARQLAGSPRDRRREGLFLVEGVRGLEEALATESAIVWTLVAEDSVDDETRRDLIERALARGVSVQPSRASLLQRLAPTTHGVGLLAACRLPRAADDPGQLLRELGDGLVVVLWQVQDPGNIGSTIRSAAGFGAAGVVTVGGADPWTPKAVRASAGAIHRIAVARSEPATNLEELLARSETRVLCALPRAGTRPSDVDWSGRLALIIGAEVAGVPNSLAAVADEVSIETTSAVESLSVPIAASILLHCAQLARRGR